MGFLTLTGGLPLSKNLGVGAVNVTLFSVKDFPNYDENGKQLADLGASDFSMTFGMARVFNVLGKLNTGVNLKIFSTKLNQISSFSFAIDFGAQKKFNLPVLVGDNSTDNLILGLVFQNIGLGQKFVAESSSLPMKLRLGGNYQFYKKGKIDGSVLLEINGTAGQGFKTAVGLETGLYEIFKVRLGYKLISKSYGKLSFGLSAGYNVGNYRLGVVPPPPVCGATGLSFFLLQLNNTIVTVKTTIKMIVNFLNISVFLLFFNLFTC